jgi:hypothetical protein
MVGFDSLVCQSSNTTIPFLCTRVKQPDEDDWKKLLRMLKYIDLTKELELTLEAIGGEVLLCKWYPDAASAVHNDMKSHTGAILTLGKGAVNTISARCRGLGVRFPSTIIFHGVTTWYRIVVRIDALTLRRQGSNPLLANYYLECF